MITSFRHEGLRELFETGKSRRVRPDLQKRCIRAMELLDQIESLRELTAPGYGVHPLRGVRAGRYALSVGQPWRITFVWENASARELNLEQYH